MSYSPVCYHIGYIRRGCKRVIAELKPPISLAQLPQVLAWQDLDCAPSVTGLAKSHSEEAHAKHALRLDSLNAHVLELVEDPLDNFRIDEYVFGNDILDRCRPTRTGRVCSLASWAPAPFLWGLIGGRIRQWCALSLELFLWRFFGR